MLTRLGGGSFADVYKAREKSTGELVAIKILKKKYKKWEECLELRECKSLQILNKSSSSSTYSNEKGFENIIKLKRIIFINKTGVLNLVFEYMENDLLILMKSYEPKQLQENQIKEIIYQTLLGLSFMHKYGFFHRDIKPENILITGEKVKIADFGLAREIRSIPPYTEYVSTRYYRAPECILKSTNYNSPVDIWALGCVMAEMYLHPQPLFYGANEKEVFFRICSILGTPTYDIWPEGIQQANLIGFKFPNSNKTELENIITNASKDAIDLMKQMLKWDPNKRASASNLLNHKFFDKFKNYSSNNSDFSNVDFNLDNCNAFYNNNNNRNYNRNRNKNKEDNNNKNKLIDDNTKESNNFELGDNIFSTNKENENKNEENNFSKMLNDTDGFNKLLNQLKQEKMQEDKDYEKQKNDNNFNNLFLSIEKKLDINTSESKSNINKNNINHNNKNNDNNLKNIEKEKPIIIKNIYINPNKKKDKLPFLTEFKFKEKDKIIINNKFEKKINTLDIGFNKDNLTNKDNNDEFAFEKAKKLKPINNNNRRGSARKFLEENENKMDKFPKINSNHYDNININANNNERKLKYNYSNNILGNFGLDKKEKNKPNLVRNEFSFVGNLNGIYDKKPRKNFELNNINYDEFKKRDFNYGRNKALTNNNITPPYFLNNNKQNENNYNKRIFRRNPNFFNKENI